MGRFSGLAMAVSTVADKLRQDRELGQKQNLLGVEGLIKGDITPAKEGDQGSFSVPGVGRVSAGENVGQQLKQENLKYIQNVNKQMSGEKTSNGANLIARRADTGEEVDLDTAQNAIAQGDRNYIINQRQITKAGIKENPLIKAPDLTQEEKQYMITSKRVLSSLNALQDNIYPKLDKLGGNKNWQAAQAQGLPFWAIGNQDIEDYKSALVQLKSDIPFLRGGKQLTATEAKRVDILLNPFGKSEETRIKDVKRFQDEFLGGQEIMLGGVSALSKQKSNISNSDSGFRTTPRGNKFKVIE